MQAFEQRDEGSEPDREGGHQDVPGDQPGELQSRQEYRVQFHHLSAFSVSLSGLREIRAIKV